MVTMAGEKCDYVHLSRTIVIPYELRFQDSRIDYAKKLQARAQCTSNLGAGRNRQLAVLSHEFFILRRVGLVLVVGGVKSSVAYVMNDDSEYLDLPSAGRPAVERPSPGLLLAILYRALDHLAERRAPSTILLQVSISPVVGISTPQRDIRIGSRRIVPANSLHLRHPLAAYRRRH